MLAATKTITLEAFEAQLRGTSILWYITDHSEPQYPPGFTDQVIADNIPFQKKFLVMGPQTPSGWRLIDDFDCVFRPVTSIDWSLLLTLLTNAGKPILCILAPLTYPPSQLLAKLPTTITFVSLVYLSNSSTTPTLASAPALNSSSTNQSIPPSIYQTILLPPLTLDIIPMISFPQHFGVSNPSWSIATVLRDLHGAGASLVLSTTQTQQKQFFWYYTSVNQLEPWSFQQTKSFLGTLGSL